MSSLLLRSASQVLKNPEISRAKKIKLRIHALSFGCTATQTCFHQVLLGIHLSHKRSDKVTIIPRPLPSSTIVKATDHDHEKKDASSCNLKSVLILQQSQPGIFPISAHWYYNLQKRKSCVSIPSRRKFRSLTSDNMQS